MGQDKAGGWDQVLDGLVGQVSVAGVAGDFWFTDLAGDEDLSGQVEGQGACEAFLPEEGFQGLGV